MKKDFVNFTATPRLLELLSSISHEISFRLIESIKYRNLGPISYLDFGNTNDTLSFVHCGKIWELRDKYGDDYKSHAWTSKRSSIKIGKAIKLIFSDMFPVNQPKGSTAPKPPIDIESFVNMFKSERDKNNNYERFEIVKGLNIRYWYNQENYSRFIQEDTTLAKSCSRYKEAGKYLQMYVDNPDVVNMLILKDDVNRLRGRAIIWNLTEPEGRIYMDRVYSINDCDVESFKTYAKERGWLYKSRQTYGYHHNIIDGKNDNEYNWENFLMKAQTNPKEYKYYPYLDTICVYNRETGSLCNDGRLLRKPPYYRLTHPEGGFHDEADYREMVFSRYYNQEIPREEAYYVSLDLDWVYSGEVIYIHNTGGKKSFKDSPLIVESNIMGNKKYFLKEDSVYSEYLDTYLYKDSVKEAYLDKDKKDKIIIHRRLVGKYFVVLPNGDIIKKKLDQGGKNSLEEYLEKKKLKNKFILNESIYGLFNSYLTVSGTSSERIIPPPISENSTELRIHPTEREQRIINQQHNGRLYPRFREQSARPLGRIQDSNIEESTNNQPDIPLLDRPQQNRWTDPNPHLRNYYIDGESDYIRNIMDNISDNYPNLNDVNTSANETVENTLSDEIREDNLNWGVWNPLSNNYYDYIQTPVENSEQEDEN